MDKIYQQMWATAFPIIKAGNIQIDTAIDNPADDRRGVTLLIRPSSSVNQKFQQFLQQTKAIAPNQYYYPTSDLHLTTLSIFSGQAGFKLKSINLSTYQTIIRQTLKVFPSFPIDFRGVTLSPSGIVAKGYDKTGTLNEIRTALRKAFKTANLPNTIDKRYVLKTAHVTLVRFRQPLKNPLLLANFLDKQQSIPFGTTTIHALDLVFNDWYMKEENVVLLEEYRLAVGSDTVGSRQ